MTVSDLDTATSDFDIRQVHSLEKKPEHNGKIAKLEAFDNDTLRWVSGRRCEFLLRNNEMKGAVQLVFLVLILEVFWPERQGFHQGTQRSPYMAQLCWPEVHELVALFLPAFTFD